MIIAVGVSFAMALAVVAFINSISFVGDWLHRRRQRQPVITLTPAIVMTPRQKTIRRALWR